MAIGRVPDDVTAAGPPSADEPGAAGSGVRTSERQAVVVVGVGVAAALVGAVIMRPQWVVDPGARLDGFEPAVVEES